MRPRCALTDSKRQRSGRDVGARATQARDRQRMSAIRVESFAQPAAAHVTGAREHLSQRLGRLVLSPCQTPGGRSDE